MKKLINKGFTLTELMIALVLGIIVVGSVGSIYLTTIKSSSNTLKMSKLNYEMNTLMSMMANDIRRSGYNNDVDLETPNENEFNQLASTTDMDTVLSLRADMTAAANDALADQITTKKSVQNTTSGQCILYVYDQDLDETVDNNEFFGYRLNSGVVEVRATVANSAAIVANTAEDSCTNGTWYPLTDNSTISFTNLSFSLANSTCLNISKYNGIDDDSDGVIDEDKEINCYNDALYNDAALTAFTDEVTVEARIVDITMTAQMVNDTAINTTISQSVRIRNDLLRIR